MMNKQYVLLFSSVVLAALNVEFCQAKQKMFYMDNAASTAISLEAKETFDAVCQMKGNSSGMHVFAKKKKMIENHAASIISQAIGAENIEQIVFCNNATMANNIALLGFAKKNTNSCFITSKIEHKSILNIMEYLKSKGHEVHYLDVDKHGVVNLSQLENILKKVKNKRTLVSIQTVNSELGTVEPIEKIGKIVKQYGAFLHSDASQSFCKYPMDVKKYSIDMLTISGYKIGAPEGIAALYVKDRNLIAPILFGTGDELFPGTRPTALIGAFAKAVRVYRFNSKEAHRKCKLLISELKNLKGIHINSPENSNIVSISIEGVLLSDIMKRMKQFAFSSGCSCLGMEERSNVLAAIDPKGELPSCTLRLSFFDRVSDAQLKFFAKKLIHEVKKLRKEKIVKNGCEKSAASDQKELTAYLKKIK